MSEKRLRAGLWGAAAGLAAAAIGLGVTAHRSAMARVRRGPARDAVHDAACLEMGDERLLEAAGGRAFTVAADDGTELHVEVDDTSGPGDDLTIVFCHGYALHHGCWHHQRSGLRDLGRLVFWDHRSHGRSGLGGSERATMSQLGRDLHAVLRTAVPPGSPVVLVGHSMGGMTIMTLAEQHPELFGGQVRGVGLICTSAGGLSELTYGMPAASARAVRRVVSGTVGLLGRRARIVEPGRRAGRDLGVPFVRRYGFSRDDVAPAAVRHVNEMIAGTPLEAVADFYHAVMSHDQATAPDVLGRVETLVLAGADDRLAPVEHSRAIAAAIPGARLWVIPRAGHVAMLEWPEVVDDTLRGLVRHVRDRMRGVASREESREERTA